MARKRLVPATDYGRSLYDWYKHQRRDDDTTWEPEDLSDWLAGHQVKISGKSIRDYVKGKYPKLNMAAAVADLFGVTLDEMWRHTSKPINLPRVERSTAPPEESAADADRRAHDAQVVARDAKVQADKARSAQQLGRSRKKTRPG